ncbi:MAG TPA: hypothetical protein VG755_05365 [Nannocystaceae bacterium]|nr:hypothetical protein [Nannocystaceae bacterium]
MIDDELLRDHAEEIAALPPDDPLRRELARCVHALPVDAQAELDAETAALQRALGHVDVPPIQVQRPRARTRIVPLVAIAAALLLAFALGRLTTAPPEPTAPIATAEPADDPAQTREGPRVIAVKWWHVTCPACKELDPRYADVMASFDESEVLFVTLDMSTALSRQQSALMASALGIRDFYDDVFGSSGFVVLFDATTKRELGKLSATQQNDEMKRSIRDALTRSRS